MDHIIPSLQPLAVDMDQLIPDPANARKHPTKNLTVIQNSLRLYRQRKPIVVQKTPDGKLVIRAGNGTYEAAKLLKWKQIAAVIVEEDNLSATGFALVDNKSAELAEWDKNVLEGHLFDLKMANVDIEDLGFEVNLSTEPEDKEEVKPSQEFLVVLECVDEIEQSSLFEELTARGVKCKIMS